MAEIVLLDGGMGQELVRRSAAAPSPLWSAEVMEREPDLVQALHADFIEAGARVVTFNSYSATPERLARHMETDEAERRFEALQRAAIGLARAASRDAPRPVAVAGCLPPLGGSYHPEAGPGFEQTLANYRRILAIQSEACDLVMAETMSSVAEARAAARTIREVGQRGWIALSVSDDDGTRLRSGEPLEAGCAAAVEEGAEVVLLNCSRPEAIWRGLSILAATGLPFGAYANGFTNAAELSIGGTVAGMGVRRDLGPDAYADHAMAWIAKGATIVGGCCEVGPAHIARLRERIEAAGHEIVAPLALSPA